MHWIAPTYASLPVWLVEQHHLTTCTRLETTHPMPCIYVMCHFAYYHAFSPNNNKNGAILLTQLNSIKKNMVAK